ncbi:MAG: M56 family metallopeptidase [Candidatus Aminicenantia bacterium]
MKKGLHNQRIFWYSNFIILFLVLSGSFYKIFENSFNNIARSCSNAIYSCQDILFTLINSIPGILIIIFIILFIYAFLNQVIILLKERKLIKSLTMIDLNKFDNLNKLGKIENRRIVFSKLKVFENNSLGWAFTAGLFQPKIYLSTGLIKFLTQEEFKAVITHEMSHCQKKDPLKRFVLNFMTDFLFFLPISKYLKNYIIDAQEKKADDKALFSVHSLHLASALIKVAKSNKQVYSSVLSLEGRRNLEQRVKRLIYGQEFSSSFPWKKGIQSLAILILIFNLFFTPYFYANPSDCPCSGGSINKPYVHLCCEMKNDKK